MGLVEGSDQRPLILTLRLDADSQDFFTAERVRFFPLALNFLDAHVTLFHHLPRDSSDEIAEKLTAFASVQPTFPVQLTGLRSLGRGVAYSLQSSDLLSLRASLANGWSNWLTAQDRQNFKPHITVQNKVAPAEAHRTLTLLQTSFTPRLIEAIGVDLWRYEGGPWNHLQTFLFAGKKAP